VLSSQNPISKIGEYKFQDLEKGVKRKTTTQRGKHGNVEDATGS